MTVQAPDLPACGDRLTGGWQVERVLSTVGSVPGLLVVDEVGDRAVAFVLPAEAPDPPLDEERAGRWGTLRRVFRDDTWGRLVIDGVPEGDLLEDWLAQGRELPRAWIDRLSEDVRADHRADAWHGQIAPDRIVVGEQGLVVAGWGLGESHGEAQRSRDLAALAALSSHQGACEPPSPRSDGAGSGPNISPRLQAALAADHIPTLRAALTELEASDDGGPGELARARDALQRLESRAASQLEAAERMIEQGDPLGAVAACREAIRIGEEARAQPILNRARREARRLLSGQQRDVWRRYVIYAAGAVAVLVALVSLGAWLMPSGDPSPFETRLAQLQDEGGRRAVVRWLAEQEARGEGSFESRERLSRELQRLADEERARLLELRRQTVARGARPHRADRIAETGLDTLAGLAAVDAGSPPTPAAIDQVLRDVDRAATRYRAATSIDGATAGEAIDRVLALDPLFAGAGRSR
jgi:hypothetical protein